MNDSRHGQSGQSLMELIVAMAVGAVLIVAGVAAITPVLRTTANVSRIQTSSALGKELLDNVRVLAESDWHALDSLATTSQHVYYLNTASSPFTVIGGTQSVTISTTTYTRYFYLDDVSRTTAGGQSLIDAAGTAPDPSTKKITVVYTWPQNGSNSLVSYLARTRDDVFLMDDWSGGGNQTTAVTVTSTSSFFATSSNIDYQTAPGSVVVTGF